MSTTQPRLPALAPNGTGGEFTGRLNSAPEVDVAEANSTQGSFLFPPSRYGAENSFEEYASFWMNVPISDRVLSNLVHAYAQHREAWVEKQVEIAIAKRGSEAEHRAWAASPKTTGLDIERAHAEFVIEQVKHWRESEDTPLFLGPLAARSAAISAQMIRLRGVLSEEGAKKVFDFPVYTTSDGRVLTPSYYWEKYEVGAYADRALTDQDIGVAAAIAKLEAKMG